MTTTRDYPELPEMPTETAAAGSYAEAALERSELRGGQLVFDNPTGFDQALRQGFFLVRIPEDLDPGPADLFAAHFYEPLGGDELDTYRGFADAEVPGDYQGYFDREHDQWENFYIEMGNWPLLPDAVARVGRQMTDLGIAVLRSVLAYIELPEQDWSLVTSGLSDKAGHQMLAFNHFRPEKDVRGSKFHRDSGWVTILRSIEPGLLAVIDGELSAINPVPGYFVANFGSSIEVLAEQLPKPVRANVHGVAQTERRPGQPHRWSYVTFLDSALAGTIYRYEDGVPRAVQSVAEFAVQEVNRTYDKDDKVL